MTISDRNDEILKYYRWGRSYRWIANKLKLTTGTVSGVIYRDRIPCKSRVTQRPKYRTYPKYVTLYLDEETYDQLHAQKARTGKSMCELMRLYLEWGLENDE